VLRGPLCGLLSSISVIRPDYLLPNEQPVNEDSKLAHYNKTNLYLREFVTICFDTSALSKGENEFLFVGWNVVRRAVESFGHFYISCVTAPQNCRFRFS
jgi:hypothetical protein